MSLGAISTLSQDVSMLLARMGGTQSTTAAAFPDASAAAPAAPSSASSSGTAGNALTGPTKATVSDEILALLTRLQQLASELNAGSNQPATASTPISTAATQQAVPSTSIATSNDPLSLLISAMDSNGDGQISQSEMEAYIQNLGGTAAQADALFAGLNQGNSGSLTHDQLAGDLQQAGHAFGHRGHHHHTHGLAAARAIAREMVKAADSNGDNAISQSEFESFVTGLGGTTSEADADFAALDPNSTGSLTTARLTSAIKAFESAGSAATIATNSASPILTLLDSLQPGASSNGSSTASTGTTTNVTA